MDIYEQDVNLALRNNNVKQLGSTHEEVLLRWDNRNKHYRANEVRIILEKGLLMRNYYRENGTPKCYQDLKSKHLPQEVLVSLPWDFGKNPEILKTETAYRQKTTTQTWHN